MNDCLRDDRVTLARRMTIENWNAIASGGLAKFYVEHSGDRLSFGLERKVRTEEGNGDG